MNAGFTLDWLPINANDLLLELVYTHLHYRLSSLNWYCCLGGSICFTSKELDLGGAKFNDLVQLCQVHRANSLQSPSKNVDMMTEGQNEMARYGLEIGMLQRISH